MILGSATLRRLTTAFGALTLISAPALAQTSPSTEKKAAPSLRYLDDLSQDELIAFTRGHPLDEDGELIEPSADSQPLTDINKKFENDALALLKANGLDEKMDCLNLFPDRLAMRYLGHFIMPDNFNGDEALCLVFSGVSGNVPIKFFNLDIPLRSLNGGLSEENREKIHQIAKRLGYTIDDDTLDLYIAAHELKHEGDKFLGGDAPEGRADFFAALVVQANNAPHARDVVKLFDYLRLHGLDGKGDRTDAHWRDYKSPMMKNLPTDLNSLSRLADETYARSVKTPKTDAQGPQRRVMR